MNTKTAVIAICATVAAAAILALSATGAFLKVPFIYNRKFGATLPDYLQMYKTACAEGARSGASVSGKIAPFEVSTYNPMNAGYIELTADSLILKLLPKERIAANPAEAETVVVRRTLPAYKGGYTPDGRPRAYGFGDAECLRDDYEIAVINPSSGGCAVHTLVAVGECAKVIEKKKMDSSNYHLKVPEADIVELLKQ